MSQALRLDRTRKHATVHGEVTHGLTYYQDGLPFNASGEVIQELIDTPERKAIYERKTRKSKVAKPAPVDPAATATEASATTSDDDEAGGDDDVNFDAWARGVEKVEWTTLQRIGRKRFHKTFRSKEDLVEFLVFDAKMIALDDVAPSLRPNKAA